MLVAVWEYDVAIREQPPSQCPALCSFSRKDWQRRVTGPEHGRRRSQSFLCSSHSSSTLAVEMGPRPGTLESRSRCGGGSPSIKPLRPQRRARPSPTTDVWVSSASPFLGARNTTGSHDQLLRLSALVPVPGCENLKK